MENDKVDSKRGRGASKKQSSTPRRTWSKKEEEVLMVALKELVSNGWKSDNGFRTGYLIKLEEAIRKFFPQTYLKAEPYITSKLTSWKRTYGAIISAQRDTTGVGFNTTTNMLEVTDEQWESVVKIDSNMRGVWFKEWSFFPDWIEVFGKDRATGEVAEDVTDGASTMKKQQDTNNKFETNKSDEFEDDNYVNLGDPEFAAPYSNRMNDEQAKNSTATKTKDPEPSTRTTHKWKANMVDQGETTMVSLLHDLCRTTGDHLEMIAKRIGYDHDLCGIREKVFGLLGNVPRLTTLQKIKVSEIIGAKVEKLNIFMGLTEDARAVYALHLLTVNNGG